MESMRRTADFLFEVGHLAHTPRAGFALLGTGHQSVAEHSYRAALVGMILAQLDGIADVDRVMMLCLVHDLAETRTTDLHHLAKRYVSADEEQAIADQLSGLESGSSIADAWQEYRAGQSREAHLAHDADRLELLLTLREQESRGQVKASDWLERTIVSLSTDVGRELGQAIVGGDPSAWWDAAKSDGTDAGDEG
jgi:putative hydrolase of HD superfamily